jgi:LuxR family transcriptional regulator, maltose regulon positive regulatory protein
MSPAMSARTMPLLRRAREAAARSAWAEARGAFERALRGQETPEALEGLGEAAWWLDDAAAVFDARGRAFSLFRRAGDRRGAGRLATKLAVDHVYFRGEVAVALGWFRRAHALLDGLPPCVDQGWLGAWEADFALIVRDDPVDARSRAARAEALGKSLRALDLEMTALAIRGLSLVLEGRASPGLACLDEAATAALAGEISDPLAVGWTYCCLLQACQRARDFERAAEWIPHVRTFCRRSRFNALFSVCRIHYADALAGRGAWSMAARELQEAARQLARMRPALAAEGIVRLAALRRWQGRLREAEALLRPVGGYPLAILERASLELERGAAESASRLAARFLRNVPPKNLMSRAAALEVLTLSALARGDRARAAAFARRYRMCTAGVGTEAIRARARLLDGLTTAGGPDVACAALEDAVDFFGRSGAVIEASRARLELGRVLASTDRRREAEEELAAAQASLRRVGAPRDAARAAAALRELRGRPRILPPTAPHGLSSRETDVVRLLAQGLRNREIASRLFVSPFTVKRHVANILTKLHLPSRAAAAAYAARRGLA